MSSSHWLVLHLSYRHISTRLECPLTQTSIHYCYPSTSDKRNLNTEMLRFILQIGSVHSAPPSSLALITAHRHRWMCILPSFRCCASCSPNAFLFHFHVSPGCGVHWDEELSRTVYVNLRDVISSSVLYYIVAGLTKCTITWRLEHPISSNVPESSDRWCFPVMNVLTDAATKAVSVTRMDAKVRITHFCVPYLFLTDIISELSAR